MDHRSGLAGRLDKFSLTEPRYDPSTFLGRFRGMLDVIDPSTLFTSDTKLNEAVQLLKEYEQCRDVSKMGEVTHADLWKAKKIRDAILHPDTGEKIPHPFRMSGFVPFGVPVVTGMLLPNQTTLSTAFWQWLNQSHNAAVNYCNRNASGVTTTEALVQGYCGAVGAALAVSLTLGQLVKRLPPTMSPATKSIIQRLIPFPSVAAANVSNVILMRRTELKDGIDVKLSPDIQGEVVGVSKAAAKKALAETSLSRIVLPFPLLVVPPLVMGALEKTKFLKSNPRYHLPVQVVVCSAAFAFALPLAISVFPQWGSIDKSEIEEEFRAKLPNTERLFYNKGL